MPPDHAFWPCLLDMPSDHAFHPGETVVSLKAMDRDAPTFCFGAFTLDQSARELRRGELRVPLQPRYFDALVLLLCNHGQVVSKDRFFDEVWQQVTVGDEALTQAIKDLRKALGDDASSPTYIMTHPKRGYRFIAPVTRYGVLPATRTRSSEIVLAGTAGGGAAGLVGGLAYGVAATIGSDHGSAILAVLSVLTVGVALLGALGICTGMAAAARIAGRAWTFSPVGAAIGGFVTGELFHLLGTRSFSLLIGRAYDGFTGGIEGLTLGGAIALGAKLAGGIDGSPRRVTAGGALGGAFAGIVISLAGGQLMAASIAGLARSFKGSQLETGPFGKFADPGVVGSLGQGMITAGEGLLFGGCVVAAIMVRYRRNHG